MGVQRVLAGTMQPFPSVFLRSRERGLRVSEDRQRIVGFPVVDHAPTVTGLVQCVQSAVRHVLRQCRHVEPKSSGWHGRHFLGRVVVRGIGPQEALRQSRSLFVHDDVEVMGLDACNQRDAIAVFGHRETVCLVFVESAQRFAAACACQRGDGRGAKSFGGTSQRGDFRHGEQSSRIDTPDDGFSAILSLCFACGEQGRDALAGHRQRRGGVSDVGQQRARHSLGKTFAVTTAAENGDEQVQRTRSIAVQRLCRHMGRNGSTDARQYHG